MARLASAAKGGFYPLPPVVTELVLTHLAAPQGGRILDPCAGEGEALATLAERLGLEAYGIELHQERAAAATECLSTLTGRNLPLLDPHERRIVAGDYRLARVARHGANLLYINPPYDSDHEDGRLEYQWLRDTREWLQPDGVLLFVVPQHVLGYGMVARYLASWYRDVTVWRFPDDEYERFKQVVLFGVRAAHAGAPEEEALARYREIAGAGEALAMLGALSAPTYTLPPARVSPAQFTFQAAWVEPADALAEAGRVGVRAHATWRGHLAPRAADHRPVRPLMPLKVGHLAGLLAAGFLDHQRLADGTEELLVRGRAYKRARYQAREEELPDGRVQRVQTMTEQVVVDVTTLAPDGAVQSLTGAKLEAFMARWLEPLTSHVARRYPPQYPFQLGRYAGCLATLSQARRIPRTDRYGLMPAQQHAAAACATRLAHHKDAILVGECGSGKTSVGAAVAALLDAPRTVVLCPPHLVEKWQREAKIVWPALEVSALTTISDVARFFAPSEGPRLGVLSHSKAKLASGWRAAYDNWLPTKEQLLAPYALHLVGTASPEELETYYTEHLAQRALKYARWRGVRCPDCGSRVVGSDGLPLAAWQIEKRRSRLHCRACGGALYQFDRKRGAKQSPGSFRDHVRREAELRAWRASCPEPDAAPPTFPAPAGYARWPLARYLRAHHAGELDLLLADELHQFAGMDSDQGYAFADLAVAARRVLGLTGTIYGGKASSLFHLLYRLSPEMCRAFTDTEETGQRRLRHKPWVERYGVLQEIETTPVREADGKLTANPRSTVRVQELPGASPALLPWLLDRAVFLSLADMGFALPDYAEIPLEVELSEPMRERYDALWKALHDELAERLVRGDKSLLGAYLQSLLNWVDSPWRAEVVLDPYDKREGLGDPRVIARIAGLPAEQLFPKEEAVLDLVREERARGRRCVLYVHQTATRDITPRWVALFQAAGLKAVVLKCAPTEREAWLAQQVAADVDVVITHPRRVETGLDLIAFPTLIWLAPDYSVYTTIQASRRAWRIGQEEPCKVYFLCYSGTLQADALRLIAAKVAATLRVSGEIVATESLAELDELAASDMVSALAKLVVERGTGEVESLEEAFAAASADLRASQAVVGGYQMAEPEGGIIEGVVLAEVEADVPVRATLPAPLAGAAPPPLVAPPLPVLPGARPHVAQPSLLEVTTPVLASPPIAEEVSAAVGTEPEAADEPEGKPPFPVLPLAFPEVGVPTPARHKVGAGSLWEALRHERKVA
ncbi:MAG: methyltransferase [Ardenticatenales bacterium]|nr:methyltransferase [Ardenticatenales bacterium]